METLRLSIPVIAITGSAGKSTTKEMLASILQKKYRIFKSRNNQNAYTNTKKYAEQITAQHQAVVLEYGIKSRDSLRKHCAYIEPNIGVVTNIGTAHIGLLGNSIEGVAKAKSQLIKYMKQDGILFLNADDKNSELLDKKSFRGRIYYIGYKSSANFRLIESKYLQNGMQFKLKIGNKISTFTIPAYGEHNVYNAVMAIAVAHILGINEDQIKSGLKDYHRLNSRLIVYHLKKGVKLIDDSFSANPESLVASLSVLKALGGKKKIAVLGSMLELGKYTLAGSEVVGKAVAKSKIDRLFTVGSGGKLIGKSAIKNGFPEDKVISVDNLIMLYPKLMNEVKENSVILIKASHDMHFKQIVEYVKEKMSYT